MRDGALRVLPTTDPAAPGRVPRGIKRKVVENAVQPWRFRFGSAFYMTVADLCKVPGLVSGDSPGRAALNRATASFAAISANFKKKEVLVWAGVSKHVMHRLGDVILTGAADLSIRNNLELVPDFCTGVFLFTARRQKVDAALNGVRVWLKHYQRHLSHTHCRALRARSNVQAHRYLSRAVGDAHGGAPAISCRPAVCHTRNPTLASQRRVEDACRCRGPRAALSRAARRIRHVWASDPWAAGSGAQR